MYLQAGFEAAEDLALIFDDQHAGHGAPPPTILAKSPGGGNGRPG
jgi:hypothetical protein